MKYPGKIFIYPPEKDPQLMWFQEEARKVGLQEIISGKGSNPCVKLYGPGPDGMRCKECKLLFRHTMSKTYFKCDLRGFTRGEGTDHKANWPACGRFYPISAS